MIEDRIELSKVIEGLSNPATIKKESNLSVKVVDQTKLIPGKSSSSTEESSAVLARIIFQENIIPIADLLQGKRKKSGYVNILLSSFCIGLQRRKLCKYPLNESII